MILDVIIAALLSPRAASVLAPLLIGEPSIIPAMLKICERESHCQVIGVHDNDARYSRGAWKNAVRVGWLSERCQAYHDGWSTRGAWGTIAAYTVRHLGECKPAWILDVPMLGAIASARRMTAPGCTLAPACRSWRGF